MTVVFDSNIWITHTINRQLSYIESLHKNGITIAGCKDLLHELISVLARPKFEKYFTLNYLEDFFKLYLSITTNFELSEIKHVVADEKDNYLFALCEISNADYFVTGDKLLLAVDIYNKTAIKTLSDFKKIFI